MTPKPYSDKSSLPTDSSNDVISGIPTEDLPQTPSPASVSGATTPSPTPQEYVPVETFTDPVTIQESYRIPDLALVTPCYPTPGDIMPYDHSLPDFIRQITNQPNLANLQSLSLRVISTLISLHRMATYLPNLRELDLEGSVLNSLRDIGCSLKNLQILKVGRCQLESLDGTFGLSSLRELYAQKNLINDRADSDPSTWKPKLRHRFLMNLRRAFGPDICSKLISLVHGFRNRIRNISYAGFLSVCSKLKSIVFTGNPATEVSGYRHHVRRILPQVETLDGIPFSIEDSGDEITRPDLIENYCGGSDCSADVADFSVSPSDSVTNLLNSDSFLSDKKNKQAKNLANQDQSDSADCEKPEASADKPELRLQDELQNLSIHHKEAKKGMPGQAKTTDNRHANAKQKCTSIQKLDKDIENRSKKSNFLSANFGEEFVSAQEFANHQVSDGDDPGSPSSSAAAARKDDSRKCRAEEESARPTTTASASSRDKAEEMKHGVIKRRPSSAAAKNTEEDQSVDQNWGVNKLTTGLPVCGNLTAALRSRKKIKNAWAETNFFAQTVQSSPGEEVDAMGSGDNPDTECGAFDVFPKWKEISPRFGSNDYVSSWEKDEIEGDESDESEDGIWPHLGTDNGPNDDAE